MLDNHQSEFDTITVRLPGLGYEFKNVQRVSIDNQFLRPCSGFQLEIDDSDPIVTNELLIPGARIDVLINGTIQLSGYIDSRSRRYSRGGSAIEVRGRDILGPLVDGCLDPKIQSQPGKTVLDVVSQIAKMFGVTVANPGALSKPLPSKQRPKCGEGAYQYLERLLKHQGLHAWAAVDGSGLVVSAPDFDSPPLYSLSTTDVEDGRSETNYGDQPACIVAVGHGGQKDVAKAALKCIVINELVGTDESGSPLPEVQTIIDRYKGAKVLPMRPSLQSMRGTFAALVARPVFLFDDSSKTISELEKFARRAMAEHQKKALRVEYTIPGLSRGGQVWSVNTSVAIDDPRLGLNQTLWIESVRAEKSPGGTRTHLTLILPRTLELS